MTQPLWSLYRTPNVSYCPLYINVDLRINTHIHNLTFAFLCLLPSLSQCLYSYQSGLSRHCLLLACNDNFLSKPLYGATLFPLRFIIVRNRRMNILKPQSADIPPLLSSRVEPPVDLSHVGHILPSFSAPRVLAASHPHSPYVPALLVS